MVKNEYPSSYSSDVEKMSHEDLMGLLDYLDSIKGKADGGVIGIEVKIADEMAKGGRVGLFSGGALKGLASLFKAGKDKIADFAETQANKKMFRSADDIPPTSISQATGPITIEMLEAVDPSIVRKVLRTQELGLYEETPEILKAANLLERFTKKIKGKRVIDYERAEDILGVSLKGDETINDLFRIEFETRPVEKMADGGRVGFNQGGWADGLEGEAKGIYDSMTAYGASDAEIQSKLQAQNLWSPDGSGGGGTGTGQVTGIINQNIGRDDGPYAGQIVDQTDYSFNKKNYAPGGKLEINPAALGIGFYESGPGKVKDQLPQSFVEANKHLSPNQQKDKYYTGKEVGVDYGALEAKEPGFMESFMGAAVPNKMKSTVTMPGYEQFQSVNPSEFRSFIDANIEGIPGDLTRQDLANMYEDYNKFTGRRSNYVGARVPGTAGNFLEMAMSGMTGIPFVGKGINKLGEFFGPQGDRSMQSKYSVDNAGYGQGTSRDEFGTFTGGKTLMGKTNDYVERMQNDVNFLENEFFGDIMGDTDFENLTESQITAMQKKNGFNFKKLQAYKNRLATEKINTDFAKKQAEIEAAKRAAEIQAAQGRVDRSEEAINKATEQGIAINKNEGVGSVNPNSAYGKSQNYTGGSANPHTQTGWSGSYKKKDGGLIGYNRGGLATMFTRRR
jgi:hypothetical protein